MPRKVLPVLLLAVTACGGPASVPPSVTVLPDPAVTELASMCTDVVAVDLGDGTLCVDSGFRMDTDRFSFANWGRSDAADENVTVQTLVDLFGHSAVCMPGREDSCILRPRTRQVLEDWNVALDGGRCEGMAVLSQRMFLRWDLPQDFGPAYATADALPRSARGLTDTIVYWWATQFVPEVSRAAADSRTKTPARLVVDLIRGLANGTGQTVGMYDEGAGHSVTPFAVTRRGGGWVIHVYDNNDPGRRHEITVDPAGGSWRYDAPDRSWSGDTGTLEITSMAVRNGPFTCDFCAGPESPTVANVSVSAAAGSSTPRLFIDSDSGVLEQTDRGIESGIEGALVDATKGTGSSSLRVSLPRVPRTMSVELRAAEGVPSTPAVVSVRIPGSPDVQVRGALAAAPPGGARSTRPVVEVDDKTITVHARDGTVAVSIAGAGNLGSVTVPAGGSVVLSPLRDGRVVLTYETSTVRDSVTLEMSPDKATDTNITVKNGMLGTTVSGTPPRPVTTRRVTGTAPRPSVTTTVRPVASTVPTVDVTLPG